MRTGIRCAVFAAWGLMSVSALEGADVRMAPSRVATIPAIGHLIDRPAPDETARIRSHSKRIVGAMAEARRRSHTFRALSDRLEHGDLIIYLESGRCAGVHVLSCLSITSGANAQRYLRITIDTEHSRAVIIQQIAHELQHAIELAGVPQVADADSLRAFYSRIGSADMAPDTFETIAALAVAAAVWSELK